MPRLRTIARRGFLIGSAAIAGGVAFGVYKALKQLENPLLQGLKPDEVTFNPWIKIDSENITLILPHADTGQGVAHMQALLIAEEMDLDVGQFVADFGPPSQAYYNHAVAAEGLPFLTSNQSGVAETARELSRSVSKIIGLQITGGSTSVPDSFDKLRLAGAVARETLKRAVASKFAVTVASLRTDKGMVVLPDGQRIPYQALAEQAATVDPEDDVPLRDPANWRLIGKPTQRSDILAKSTGQMDYGIDLHLPGMRHATVRLSPTRGPVVDADLAQARAIPGVTDIHPITSGFAVLADNTWSAMQGALAIEAEWEPPAHFSAQEDHWDALTRALDEDEETANWRDDGDMDAALSEADILDAEYRAPYVAHQPLEPLNASVLVTDGAVEIWASTQVPRFAQRVAAQVSGLSSDQIILHNQFGGGSFGHRLELDHIRAAVEVALVVKDQPVKLTYSREEDFAQDYPRHIGLARARGHVSDGKVAALSLDIAGAAPSSSQAARLGIPLIAADMQLGAGAWNAPYALENFRVRSFEVDNLAPVSSWRSVGASTNGFFLEGFLDELIHAAGADPLEERLRLCNWDVARGALEAVAEMCDWGISLGSDKGRGVALVESFGVPAAEVVEVTRTRAGIRIDNVWVAADAGMVVDPVNFENQVQGGVIWGLGHAINSEITYADGAAEQSNYYDAEGLRLYQTPQIKVRALQRNPKIRGIGEPPVPPAAPALANAVFAATGQRLREMPFQKFIEFV